MLVSAKPNPTDSFTHLPWGGTIYVKCDGRQQVCYHLLLCVVLCYLFTFAAHSYYLLPTHGQNLKMKPLSSRREEVSTSGQSSNLLNSESVNQNNELFIYSYNHVLYKKSMLSSQANLCSQVVNLRPDYLPLLTLLATCPPALLVKMSHFSLSVIIFVSYSVHQSAN